MSELGKYINLPCNTSLANLLLRIRKKIPTSNNVIDNGEIGKRKVVNTVHWIGRGQVDNIHQSSDFCKHLDRTLIVDIKNFEDGYGASST